MANWSIEFTSRTGKVYSVAIGGMPSPRTLTPATNPFITQGDTNEDYFKPIRTETGYIRIVADPNDVSMLFGSVPQNHAVVVSRWNSSTSSEIVWTGHIKQESFTQDFEDGKTVIEIPVQNTLQTLQGLYMSKLFAPITIGTMFRYIFTKTGNVINNLYFPSNFNIGNLSSLYIQPMNWMTRTDVDQGGVAPGKYYIESTWYAVLEDVCKVFGWQLQQSGRDWYFLSKDVDNGQYNMVSASNVEDASYSYTRVYCSDMSISGKLRGTGFTRTVNVGKKSVKVTGNPGEMIKDVFNLDLESVPYSSVGDKSGVSKINPIYDYSSTEEVYTEVTVNGNSPLKNGTSGCGVEAAAQLDYSLFGPTDSFVKSGLTFCGAGTKSISIKPKSYVNIPNSDKYYLQFSADFSYIKTYEKGFSNIGDIFKTVENKNEKGEVVSTTDVRVDRASNHTVARFAGKYYSKSGAYVNWTTDPLLAINPQLMFDKSGVLNWGDTIFPRFPGNNIVKGVIKLPAGSGTFEINFYDGFTLLDEKNQIISDSIVGVMLSNIKLSIFKEVSALEAFLDGKTNEEYKKIDGGFAGDYEISMNLTCARGNQDGTGCIWEKNYSGEYDAPWYLINYQYPESYLLDRAVRVYGRSYNTYNLRLENGGAPFSPINTITPESGIKCWMISQRIDWREETSEVSLMQI